jgi:hypothetical protein
MEIEAKLIADIWETIKEFVVANKREELATAFLNVFVDNDVEILEIEELRDIDDDLDSALDVILADEEDDEE